MRRVILILALCFSSRASAQAPIPVDSVRPGAMVRVWSREPKLKGWKFHFGGVTDSSLVLEELQSSPKIAGFPNRIPVAELDRVELYKGVKLDGWKITRRAMKGAGWGGLIVLVAGTVAGSFDHSGEGYGPLAGVLLAPVGVCAGGIIGGVSGLRGINQWVPVRVGREP